MLIVALRAVGPWIYLVEEAEFFQVAFVCLVVVTINDTDVYLLGLQTQVCRRGEETLKKKMATLVERSFLW